MKSENTSDTKQAQALNKTDVMQSVIKGQELRVGNLVYFNGNHKEIGVVSEIMKNDLNKVAPYKIGINHRVDIYYDIDKLKPIPLTEKWLLTNDFKKHDRINGTDYHLHPLVIMFKNKDIWMIQVQLQTIDKSVLNYVHQLQNLYFSLTGRELTVA